MQVFKPLGQDDTALVGWGVSVLVASSTGPDGLTARRLAGLGAQVVVETELYNAMSLLLDDPREADMLVIDCDDFGGIEAGRRAFGILADAKLRLPVVLISSECREQTFPLDRAAPFVLRAPVSAVALRIGFESAFQSRLTLSSSHPGSGRVH